MVTPRKTEDRTDETISFVMTEELKEVLKEIRSVPPLNSIYLFKNHRHNRGVGEALIKPDGTTTGFDSQWQRWQRKFPKEKRFAERSLRNLVGSEDDLQTIRKKYLKLSKEHHPDLLISKGVPKEVIEESKKKMRTINSAWNQIQKLKSN